MEISLQNSVDVCLSFEWVSMGHFSMFKGNHNPVALKPPWYCSLCMVDYFRGWENLMPFVVQKTVAFAEPIHDKRFIAGIAHFSS